MIPVARQFLSQFADFSTFIQENTSDIECDIELYARERSRNTEFEGSE